MLCVLPWQVISLPLATKCKLLTPLPVNSSRTHLVKKIHGKSSFPMPNRTSPKSTFKLLKVNLTISFMYQSLHKKNISKVAPDLSKVLLHPHIWTLKPKVIYSMSQILHVTQVLKSCPGFEQHSPPSPQLALQEENHICSGTPEIYRNCSFWINFISSTK